MMKGSYRTAEIRSGSRQIRKAICQINIQMADVTSFSWRQMLSFFLQEITTSLCRSRHLRGGGGKKWKIVAFRGGIIIKPFFYPTECRIVSLAESFSPPPLWRKKIAANLDCFSTV